MDNRGTRVDNGADMDDIVVNYYENIFCSSVPSSASISLVVDSITQRCSSATVRHLDRSFTAEEIRLALFQMVPAKALGVNGFTIGFYQKLWSIISGRVTTTCLRVLNKFHLMEAINKILIVLIPKVAKAMNMGDFHAISLCNVTNKLIAKSQLSSPSVRIATSWVPPMSGLSKLNTYASLNCGSNLMGLGLVVRNSAGLVMATGAVRMRAYSGLTLVQVEYDTLNVINILRNRFIPCSDLGLIVSDILQADCLLFIPSFSYISRSANKVVDALMKVALGYSFDVFLIDSCPPSMESLVQNDYP
ncbi:hypothetical protein ACOSQ3_021258 [Xanthoceras sorbifolium]